jgi:hypothetical protein
LNYRIAQFVFAVLIVACFVLIPLLSAVLFLPNRQRTLYRFKTFVELGFGRGFSAFSGIPELKNIAPTD